MNLFFMLLRTVMFPILFIWPCRETSMTFNTFSRSITIKNNRLAELLIAEKNTWGIATDPRKRNTMSLLGVISYMVFLPQIAFIPYDWWVFIETGSGQWGDAEQAYMAAVILYDVIALSIKLKEAIKFSKGEIW